MLRAIENYPLTKQQTINFEFLTTVMKRSSKAKNVLARINANTKLGDQLAEQLQNYPEEALYF